MSDRPRRVCLVGSSRFKATFHEVAERLEKSGHLVLMMGFFQHADRRPVSDQERAVLERVDRHRLDLADEVLVIDCPRRRCPGCKAWYDAVPTHVGTYYERNCSCWDTHPVTEPIPFEEAAYVGESTRLEIAYAEGLGKPVRYLSEEGGLT